MAGLARNQGPPTERGSFNLRLCTAGGSTRTRHDPARWCAIGIIAEKMGTSAVKHQHRVDLQRGCRTLSSYTVCTSHALNRPHWQYQTLPTQWCEQHTIVHLAQGVRRSRRPWAILVQ
jgi:hypothetical protein